MRKLRADLRRTLKSVFGLDSLRRGQDEVIDSVLSGRDTLAIMPTGAGKSLCYQLPALVLPGVTVVVSPLIALIKDQYDKLRSLGVVASQVNSAMPAAAQEDEREKIARPETEFIFTTPEQLANSDFTSELASQEIDLLVIDEVHCISQWGHDFRPAYLGLRGAAEALGRPPILALTATATEQVVQDVRDQLGLVDPNVVRTGIYRSNLQLVVRPVGSEDEKEQQTIALVSGQTGSTIVYTSTIAHAESVAQVLKSAGRRAERYHGKLRPAERHEIQNAFMAGTLDTIVATNAFGMGIDKPDIRLVLHYDMPGSLDAYYQEAGRAGRDGEPADCVLLFRRQDQNVHNFLMAGRYPTLDAFIAVFRIVEAANAPLSLAEIEQAAGGVARSKVRVILSSLKDAGVIAERRGHKFALRHAAAIDEITTLAGAYLARAEDDRKKLEEMVIYGQTALCRWGMLLKHFGVDELDADCGHCDNCRRAIS